MTVATSLDASTTSPAISSAAPMSAFPLARGQWTDDPPVLLRRKNFRLTPTEVPAGKNDIPSWMARPRCPGSFRRTL